MLPVDDDITVDEDTYTEVTDNYIQSNTSTPHTPLRLRGGGKNTKNRSTLSSSPAQHINNISIMYTNPDSLGNKLDELGEIIREKNPAIVAVNEVKHKGTTACQETFYNLDMPQYNVLFNNIEQQSGRGQMIMYKRGIAKQVYMNTAFSEGLYRIKVEKQRSSYCCTVIQI